MAEATKVKRLVISMVFLSTKKIVIARLDVNDCIDNETIKIILENNLSPATVNK